MDRAGAKESSFPVGISRKSGVERSSGARLVKVQERLWREEARRRTYRRLAGPKPSWKIGRKI